MNKKLLEAFDKAGVHYIIKPLLEGDFTNEKGTFVAERKSTSDWWSSMVDNRLLAQVAEMYAVFGKNRYVFVENNSLSKISFRKGNRGWVYKIWGVVENWGINVREYNSFVDLALKLQALDSSLGNEKVVRERRKSLKKKSTREKVLMSFERIGEKTAISWLKELSSLMNIFEDIIKNNAEKSDKVKGISRKGKIIKNMRDALIG